MPLEVKESMLLPLEVKESMLLRKGKKMKEF
jgi:hypothetical protein